MDIVHLGHGGGGELTEELVKDIFIREYSSSLGQDMEDAAIVKVGNAQLAFTTDSFTVKPLFFPGGDIGRLAVCGTVNDLLMRGAHPLYLSSSFIIEEGFELELLKAVAHSMAKACKEAGVEIVTGDTKVVSRGEADQLFINTSGVGSVVPGTNISIKTARPGDRVIVSGTIGDHGMAILAARGKFAFHPPLESDCAPLVEIMRVLWDYPDAVKVLRDPTRGGVAEVLYNIAEAGGVGIEIIEDQLPVQPRVMSACNMLGLDFLQLANEGKFMAVVDSQLAGEILDKIRGYELGHDAAIIGTVDDSGLVTVKTRWGTSRILGRPTGELIPRIC